MADWVKSQYTGTQGENNLYYHDSTLENGAGDNSYRYAGSSETTNNFVCFGSDNEICPNDNLYRIIGVFGNQVKLIKYDYANSNLLGINGDYYNTYSGAGWETSYYQGSGNLLTIGVYYWNKANYSETYNATGYSNVWSYSELNNTHLNKNYVSYLDNIDTKWADKIAVTNWIVGGNTYTNIETSTAKIAYTNEIITPSTNVQTMYSEKIGLMYVSDYYFGALLTYWTYPGFSPNGASYDYRSAIAYNWMYMGLYEWTMVRQSDGAGYVFGISNSGCLTYLSTVSDDYWTYAIRPVFYLNSDVTYVSGSGTKEDSIRIN